MPTEKGKLAPITSGLIHQLFTLIPAADVKGIIDSKKTAMLNGHTDHVRLQVSVSFEAFAVLKYWGAFDAVSESGFYGNLAVEYIHKRIIGEMDALRRVNGGR